MQDDLELLHDAAVRAGEIALSFFCKNPNSWTKGKASSVSEADMAVDAYLKETLLAARPGYGWLSEETADTQDRLGKNLVFVIDPIDGTRGYLEENPNWCISLAVIEGDQPLAGVVHAPAILKTYSALRGHGSFCNETRLETLPDATMDDIVCAGAPQNESWSAFLKCRRAPFVPSLALRLARVASGEFGAAFSRPNSYDWDIAAAHLIIEEASGLLLNAEGESPRYNRRDLTHTALGAFSSQARIFLDA